jgi:dihydroorotase-like cyclic amidohydrolase
VNGEIKYSEIAIADGRITAVKSSVPGGEKRIDVPGGVIFPGFVDPARSFQRPGDDRERRLPFRDDVGRSRGSDMRIGYA